MLTLTIQASFYLVPRESAPVYELRLAAQIARHLSSAPEFPPAHFDSLPQSRHDSPAGC